MINSWKTTVCGSIMIAAGIFFYIKNGDKILSATMITAGIGLLSAKDYNVTGGTKQQ